MFTSSYLLIGRPTGRIHSPANKVTSLFLLRFGLFTSEKSADEVFNTSPHGSPREEVPSTLR